MSIINDPTSSGSLSTTGSLSTQFVPAGGQAPKKLHRIASVRNQQGMSLRSVSRQMGRTMSTVRLQEDETQDLRLSDLRRWQKVLGVPLQDLLVDESPQLSRPVMERARMVRLMKTAAALKDNVEDEGSQRLATMLVQQLIEIMPELEDVSAWHSVGQRRSLDEYGRIVERRISDEFFGD